MGRLPPSGLADRLDALLLELIAQVFLELLS